MIPDYYRPLFRKHKGNYTHFTINSLDIFFESSNVSKEETKRKRKTETKRIGGYDERIYNRDH